MTLLKTRRKRILPLLGALCIITPFAVDMYLPAFSAIAAAYRTTTAQISLSLSTYFIGFALGQVLYGPLLDRFGRKRPLYSGLAVYILCSIGCALAPGLRSFAAFRFVEALGGCVAQVGAIAMVHDFFPVKESAKIFSLLFLMIGTSPLLAPTIGSVVMGALGWPWIFGLLAAIAFLVLALVFLLLPEGHNPDRAVSLLPGPILADFLTIAKDPQFLTYTLAGAFSFAGLFAFVAGSPIIFMEGFHMGARAFGLVFAVLVMGFIGGSQINVFLLRRFGSRQIFLAALSLQVLIGVCFLAGVYSRMAGLKSVLVLFFAFLSCIGLTYPNAAALALARFSRNAGRASALLGFMQNGAGALISVGIGMVGVHAVVLLLSSTAIAGLAILAAGQRFIGETMDEPEREPALIL